MALTNIAASSNATITIPNTGYVLYVRTNGAGSAKLTVVSGCGNFAAREFSGQINLTFPASGSVNIAMVNGSCDYEALSTTSLGNASIGQQPEDILTTKVINVTLSGTLANLTNEVFQATNLVDNFTQIAIQNKSATANSSSDVIAYPDNVTSSNLTGFADMGITSSTYSQAAYSVTGANEAYFFSSAPSGASKSGSMVHATDSSGTNNNIEYYVGGFSKAKEAYSMRILGANGLMQVKEGYSEMSKVVAANGATTTYTYPAKCSYVYITSSAASLQVTLPAAAANIDGLKITIVPDTTIATATWLSTGATFAGAPASFAANTPVRMVYDHASLKWYPA